MASLKENRRRYVFAALLLVLIYFCVGFYPFHLKGPPASEQANGAIALPAGEVQFRAPGIGYTESAPSWLSDAISTSRFAVSLDVRTADQEQFGPARIFTISLDRSHRNLTVGQWGPDLSVRVRTPYTSADGVPPYSVKNVFADSDWHQVDVRIRPGNIEIRVDGDSAIQAQMPDQTLASWDPEFRLALGNELSGDKPWLGDIRRAVVRVDDRSFDYLAPGALKFPRQFVPKDYHAWKVVPFVNVEDGRGAISDWAINLLGFAPFGWLVAMARQPRPGVRLAIVLSAGLSFTIEAGQLLIFSGRHPSTEDLAMNILGAILGAWLAKRSVCGSATA
ncbi:MAG: VanZ family protein [Thiogranum sp.]